MSSSPYILGLFVMFTANNLLFDLWSVKLSNTFFTFNQCHQRVALKSLTVPLFSIVE